jgi:hypothetical protein
MFNKEMIASLARHLLTKGAGALVAYGVIKSDQSGAFVEIGVGIAVFLAGLAWSWLEKRKKPAAVAQPAPAVEAPKS